MPPGGWRGGGVSGEGVAISRYLCAEMRGVSVVIRRHVLALCMCAAHSCARGGAAGECAARLRWIVARAVPEVSFPPEINLAFCPYC